MIDSSDVYAVECAALAIGLSSLGLLYAYRWLQRLRPGFSCGTPLGVALAVRITAVLVVAALGATGEDLRGPDDPAFLDEASRLADGPIGAEWLTESRGDALSAVLALHLKVLGEPGAASLRLLQAGIGVLGIMLVAFAVYELAGRRAALVVAWLLAVEPANVFFSSILQKEAILMVAGGLALVGVARLWRNELRSGAILCLIGVLIAAGVRPYAAGFLAAGIALVTAHLVLRSVEGRLRAVAAALLAGAAVGVGGLLLFSSWGDARLAQLQAFQDSQREIGNLPLDAVDFTTPEGLARGVPRRTWDLLVRPYPWEQENLSQRLAILGTIPTWLLTLAVLLAVFRRRFVSNALPVAYMLFAVTIGYAATTANAGTGFRHRMHVVVLLSALAAIVWLQREPSSRTNSSEETHPALSAP